MNKPFLPKISIITVSFNSEKTIEETILSILNQNYPQLEYIIIDGGSNDKTIEIVDKYRSQISYFISEPDNGISDAFNKGIKVSTGDVIGIINSDDLLADGALYALSNCFSEDIDVYRGNLMIWDDLNNRRYTNIPTMTFPLNKQIKSVCHPSTFISRKAYEKWGSYRTNMKYKMDVDILYRFYQKGATFKYIDNTLAVFRLGGATSDDWRKKLPELRQMIIDNGGSSRLAEKMVIKEKIYCIMKDIAFSLLGKKITRFLKYWQANRN